MKIKIVNLKKIFFIFFMSMSGIIFFTSVSNSIDIAPRISQTDLSIPLSPSQSYMPGDVVPFNNIALNSTNYLVVVITLNLMLSNGSYIQIIDHINVG